MSEINKIVSGLTQSQFVTPKEATEALEFYDTHVDALSRPIYFEGLGDLGGKGIDMDFCRAYCRIGKSYQRSRFMAFVAKLFGTTVSEMKSQWRNIKQNRYRQER